MSSVNEAENNTKISVDIKGLMAMCSVGRYSAEKIGADAGAVVRVGNRKLYNVQLVQEYMNKLATKG